MNGALLLAIVAAFAGCFTYAIPIAPAIGGGAEQATSALHACLLLVIREDLDESELALGGGSIVSRNRVLTAAHVVRDAISVQTGFYSSRIEVSRFRRADSFFVQPLTGFDEETFENDLAIIFYQGNVFALTNVIQVAITVPTEGAASLASYGFTTPKSTQPNQFPLLAPSTVAECPEAINATETHFCAGATAPAVVCPGDNGSGLYTGETAATRRLIGVVSLITPGCVVATDVTSTPVGYTTVGTELIQGFLASQGIEPSDAAPAAPAPDP